MTKKAKIIIGVVGGVLLLGGIGSLSNNKDKNSTSSPTSNINSYSSINSSTPLNSSDTNQAEIPEPRETAIGKSDKDIETLTPNPTIAKPVNNDKTGNWRYAGFGNSNINFSEYALSYYNTRFESDKEIHAVINFTDNTTTRISYTGGILFVTVLEYVKGEEADATLMFSGKVIKDYIVYTDNGDIEDITEPEDPNSSTSESVSSVSSVEPPKSSTESAPQSSTSQVVQSTPTQSAPTVTPPTENHIGQVCVPISGRGTKYHSNPYCSNMENEVIWVSVEEAEAMGRGPCSKCH